MDKKLIQAVAGSGKTTYLINQLSENSKALIITFTNNNYLNIQNRLLKKFNDNIPDNIKIYTFFKFLYHFCYKPLYADSLRLIGIDMRDYTNIPMFKMSDDKFYISDERRFLKNKISAYFLHHNAMNEINKRIRKYFDVIYIDEVQDFSSYDLDFILTLGDTNTKTIYVGDYYQHTYDTSRYGNKNRKAYKNDISSFYRLFERNGFTIDGKLLQKSFRCPKNICDFVRKIFKIDIESCNQKYGNIFFINDEKEIIKIWADNNIAKLHYSMATQYGEYHYNFGDVKGIDSFLDVCIFVPKAKCKNIFNNIPFEKYDVTVLKLYVAITRSNRNVFFVNNEMISKLNLQ